MLKIIVYILILILLINITVNIINIILRSKLILKFLLPITNKNLKKKIPYLIIIYRINYYKIFEKKEFYNTYNKILRKDDLLKEELDYLNKNIL